MLSMVYKQIGIKYLWFSFREFSRTLLYTNLGMKRDKHLYKLSVTIVLKVNLTKKNICSALQA